MVVDLDEKVKLTSEICFGVDPTDVLSKAGPNNVAGDGYQGH